MAPRITAHYLVTAQRRRGAPGLHWADERRFGKISLAKVAYLPYPFTVRATNPNTPANP
jgi:hypothetical protein